MPSVEYPVEYALSGDDKLFMTWANWWLLGVGVKCVAVVVVVVAAVIPMPLVWW